MRNAMPMRWIEQAEAREVLAASRYETAPPAPPRRKARAASPWLAQCAAWLATWRPSGWLTAQPQPALARVAPVRGDYCRSGADEEDRRCW